MKFEILYSQSIGFWPDEIDIFDGETTEDGIVFLRLSRIYDDIADEVKPLGEWYELMAWIIFKNFYNLAKTGFKRRLTTINKSQIDLSTAKSELVANLKVEGYENMLIEFEKNNR